MYITADLIHDREARKHFRREYPTGAELSVLQERYRHEHPLWLALIVECFTISEHEQVKQNWEAIKEKIARGAATPTDESKK